MAQTNETEQRLQPVLTDEHSNHSLSKSEGTWFIHYLAFPTTHTVVKIRRSLGTTHLGIARRRRDQLLRQLSFAGGAE